MRSVGAGKEPIVFEAKSIIEIHTSWATYLIFRKSSYLIVNCELDKIMNF